MTAAGLRRAIVLGVAAGAVLAGCGDAPGELSLETAWVEPSPAGSGPAGGFLTVRNGSDRPRTLVAAASPAAARVEIHRSWLDEGGVARMARLESVEIPAGGELRFAPGGHHLMLFGGTDWAAGERVTLELVFDGDERREISAAVRPAAAGASPADAAGHSH